MVFLDRLPAVERIRPPDVDVLASAINKNKNFTTFLISTFDDCKKIYLYWIGHGTFNRLHFQEGQTEEDRTDLRRRVRYPPAGPGRR